MISQNLTKIKNVNISFLMTGIESRRYKNGVPPILDKDPTKI
jgi:hypothetical protein